MNAEPRSSAVHQGQAVIRHGGHVEEFIDATFNVPTRSDAYKYGAYDAMTHIEVRATFGDVHETG